VSFATWLRERETEETPIGDLARDVAADGCLGDRENLSAIREHLRSHGAEEAALQTLDDAWAEWRTSRPD
jgi:hypothetical protein